jgi:hypothetical protein
MNNDFIYGFIVGWIFNYTGIVGLIIGILIGMRMQEIEIKNDSKEEPNMTDFFLDKTRNIFKKILKQLI